MADKVEATAAEKLSNAVIHNDKETALNLLIAAGGACRARDLANQAEKDRHNDDKVHAGITVDLESGKETLDLYRHTTTFAGNDTFIVGLTQKRCER